MAADAQGPVEETRRGERRVADRRRSDRRAPVPAWRTPWALVAYGVAGTLLVLLMLGALGEDDDPSRPPPGGGEVVAAPPAVATTPAPPQPGAPPERALTTADFERLTIEGDAARGRRVVAQLYCETPAPVALQAGTDTVESALAALVDTTGGPRVPAAECKWGSQDDPRRANFLLLVPPERADEFSSAPVTMDGFVRRRRLIAHVEWIGKSRPLALRTVGVFRGLAQ
jgi:hypothetical protein